MKACVQRNVASVPIVVGSPTAIFFVPGPDHVVAPSHSGVTIPSVPRKRKVVAPDISATSSEKSYYFFFIGNVYIGEFIKDLMRSKIPPPAYYHIQEFLTKVCVPFCCFIHLFYGIEYLCFFIIFSRFLFF